MKSKFPGRCACGVPFGKGAEIDYNRATRRVESCPACRKSASRPDLGPDYHDMAWEDDCARACGLL